MAELDKILENTIFPFKPQKIPTKEEILSSKLSRWLGYLKKLVKSSLKEEIKEFIVFDLALFKISLNDYKLITDFIDEYKIKIDGHLLKKDRYYLLEEEKKSRKHFMEKRLPEKYMETDWLEDLMVYLEEVLEWKDCFY